MSETKTDESELNAKRYVEVEISVFKPDGYSITYLVGGTRDRWEATKRAVEEFEKQDSCAMTCLNYISAMISSPKSKERRVCINIDG